MKRQRSRNRKPSGNQNNPNRAYESNGPEGTKVRGNAQTIYEKYQQLARDANSSGDRVLAENHLQHAEHYFRMIRQMQPTRPVSEFVQRDPFSSGFDDYDDELDGETTEAEAEAVVSDEQPSEEGRYESRSDRDNRNGNRQDRDNNGNRGNRDRDRNFKDREFRQNERQNNERQNNDRQNYDRNNGQTNNGQRDSEPQYDENGNRLNGERRETRRERYERRRSQRFAEQESNMNAPMGASVPLPVSGPVSGGNFIASTEPLGGRPAPSPQPAQADFAFEPAAEAPVAKTRAPRRERAAAPVEDAAHLPAFLSRPTPVAPEPAPAEEPAKPKRTRKRKEDAAEDA